jgi:glycine/D-amino acid oxidase-like deaminating enzyme
MNKFQSFGWETNPNLSDFKTSFPSLNKDIKTDWLIIGGGLTGLSALNQLKKQNVSDKITMVDADKIGQGSSSRNSGFLVDSTLNNGATTISSIKEYKEKYALNLAGISELKAIVDEKKINCDWSANGKYHAAANKSEFFKLKKFHNLLMKIGISCEEFHQDELSNLLGTNFYKYAIKTNGGILLNPQKLCLGLVPKICKGIDVYENTKIEKFNIDQGPLAYTNEGFKIQAKKIIVAINSWMPELNIKQKYSIPLVLTSSITRPLTSKERSEIGNPKPWGVLSVKPAGATLRYTNDHRIMIRNTSEPILKTNFNFKKYIEKHKQGLKRRFPQFTDIDIENSWSGFISISRNGKPVFGNLNGKIFYAGVYNGGGLGLSVLFGAAMIDSALNLKNSRLKLVENFPQANRLPPLSQIFALMKIKLDQIFGADES